MGVSDESSRSSADAIATTNSPAALMHPQPYAGFGWNPTLELFNGRKLSGAKSQRRPSLLVQRTQTTGRRWWKFTLRPWDDDDEQDWWFASTAIPLLAATIGPLANVLSIAALVTEWRMCLITGVSKDGAEQCVWNGDKHSLGAELAGISFQDPRWCYYLNIVSLVVGFIGNFFLLCNFTNRIRYIVALPVTIIMWYIATGILIGITLSMQIHVPPVRPQQTYTQGFWHAVIAASLYLISSMLLMVNMLGYFLGHYPQHFNLTESQRTLILQTMLFFVWLAGGGAVFSTVEKRFGDGEMNWSYVNALYFCDVTILTVGFGDLFPTSDTGRGLVFPYSVGGIIMLGLMVSSISKFAAEIGSDNIIRKHVENTRVRTIGRTVTTSIELEHRKGLPEGEHHETARSLRPMDPSRPTTVQIEGELEHHHPPTRKSTLQKMTNLVIKPPRERKPKLLLLREEKDRFDAMRHIQFKTARFKRWYALCLSVTAFALLWCVGAAVFWRCERFTQQLSYFQALYFCYVSLLTIGYGDLAPISNPGRPFFVLWSLIAVPTMTILISDLGDTVINKFKRGTFTLADFTVLPKAGVWRQFLENHPWILSWLEQRKQKSIAKRRFEEESSTGPEPEPIPTIEKLAKDRMSVEQLARKLAKKIRETANDMKSQPSKRYSYEEWVELTQLIRFTAKDGGEDQLNEEEEERDLIEWDWIGEDSPMMSNISEAEFVLDRLCESMHRYIKNVAPRDPKPNKRPPVPFPRTRVFDGEKESHEVDREGRATILKESDIGPLETSRNSQH